MLPNKGLGHLELLREADVLSILPGTHRAEEPTQSPEGRGPRAASSLQDAASGLKIQYPVLPKRGGLLRWQPRCPPHLYVPLAVLCPALLTPGSQCAGHSTRVWGCLHGPCPSQVYASWPPCPLRTGGPSSCEPDWWCLQGGLLGKAISLVLHCATLWADHSVGLGFGWRLARNGTASCSGGLLPSPCSLCGRGLSTRPWVRRDDLPRPPSLSSCPPPCLNAWNTPCRWLQLWVECRGLL